MGLAIFSDLILPIFFTNYKLLDYGHLAAISVPLFFTYAITKHNLFDITVIIKRNTAWVLTSTIIIISFTLIYHATDYGNTLNITAITLLGLFWAFLANPLQNFFITTARRKFVHGWYDPEAVFTQLSDTLTTEQDRQTIFNTIAKALDDTFELENIELIIAVRDDDNQLCHYVLLDRDSAETEQILTLDHPFIEYMNQQKDPVFLLTCPAETYVFFRDRGYTLLHRSLALPFSSPEMLEGVIIIGERSNGVAFNDHDIRFFKRLIHYVAAILYRLTPFEVLEQQYFTAKQKLHEAEIQLIRSQKIEAIAHATRQCHHEIRTPLNIINMGINRVKDMDGLEKYKNIVHEEIAHALEIIDETLAITDIAKPASKEKSRIDVNAAIHRCFQTHS